MNAGNGGAVYLGVDLLGIVRGIKVTKKQVFYSNFVVLGGYRKVSIVLLLMHY